ncbi:MAG TPA: hypothetical protein VIB82_04245 [Caulobacteraceae bacterium]
MNLAALAVFALAAAPALAQEAPTRIPLDTQRNVGGVTIACTGIGQQKNDPRWQAFPIRVEFAAPGGDYLSDEALSVMDHAGKTLASVTCEGPWILLRPDAPGAYTFKGWVPGVPAPARGGGFRIPAKGQTRLVLQFPAG